MHPSPTAEELAIAEPLVAAYVKERGRVENFLKTLRTNIEDHDPLRPYIHTIRSRSKNPDHLCEKLVRKLRKCAEEKSPFEITHENLFRKINDLAGLRILHLYTKQIVDIDRELRRVIDEYNYKIIEGPSARTWDIEYEDFFRSNGIEPEDNKRLYTSVHYIIESASKTTLTGEIQVRTLSEEVWGEVDHTINYPEPTESLACSEQLKVLARVTSSATRLVDSIFTSLVDHHKLTKK